MDGKTLACGGVAGVENIRHVGALARRVMEKTPHVLLVGEGARLFALQQGFRLECLHTPESVAEWEKKRPRGSKKKPIAPRREGEAPAEPGLREGEAPAEPGAPLEDHDTVT